MTTAEREADWEHRYQAGQTAWDRGGVSPALEQWLGQGWLMPCRILIPGCGSGYEIVELAARGFQVTAVDIAPSAVNEARAMVDHAGLTAEILQRDLLDWQPDKPFDAIYEQTSLCALHPDHWPRYTRALFDWLRPGGRLYALFMQTEGSGGPPYHCSVAAMQARFSEPRWHWLNRQAWRIPHPTGLYELAFILKRNHY